MLPRLGRKCTPTTACALVWVSRINTAYDNYSVSKFKKKQVFDNSRSVYVTNSSVLGNNYASNCFISSLFLIWKENLLVLDARVSRWWHFRRSWTQHGARFIPAVSCCGTVCEPGRGSAALLKLPGFTLCHFAENRPTLAFQTPPEKEKQEPWAE